MFSETGTIFNSFLSLQHMPFPKQDLSLIWGGLVIDSPLILIMRMLLTIWPWALIESKFWIIFKNQQNLLMKQIFLLVLKMINEVTGIFSYGTLFSKERIKNFYFYLDHWNTYSDKRVTKCMEFFNYLKISELTNTFLLKPPDHSSFPDKWVKY